MHAFGSDVQGYVQVTSHTVFRMLHLWVHLAPYTHDRNDHLCICLQGRLER